MNGSAIFSHRPDMTSDDHAQRLMYRKLSFQDSGTKLRPPDVFVDRDLEELILREFDDSDIALSKANSVPSARRSQQEKESCVSPCQWVQSPRQGVNQEGSIYCSLEYELLNLNPNPEDVQLEEDILEFSLQQEEMESITKDITKKETERNLAPKDSPEVGQRNQSVDYNEFEEDLLAEIEEKWGVC